MHTPKWDALSLIVSMYLLCLYYYYYYYYYCIIVYFIHFNFILFYILGSFYNATHCKIFWYFVLHKEPIIYLQNEWLNTTSAIYIELFQPTRTILLAFCWVLPITNKILNKKTHLFFFVYLALADVRLTLTAIINVFREVFQNGQFEWK